MIALLYDPWAGIAELPVTLRHPLQLWRKAIWFRANPRDPGYMRARLQETWPGARCLEVTERLDAAALGDTREIVLLYPDAIGLGWGRIERQLATVAPHAVLQALNGRRQRMLLDPATRRALRLRRFLERTFVIELVAGLAMLIATPCLLAIDLLRGRT